MTSGHFLSEALPWVGILEFHEAEDVLMRNGEGLVHIASSEIPTHGKALDRKSAEDLIFWFQLKSAASDTVWI